MYARRLYVVLCMLSFFFTFVGISCVIFEVLWPSFFFFLFFGQTGILLSVVHNFLFLVLTSYFFEGYADFIFGANVGFEIVRLV